MTERHYTIEGMTCGHCVARAKSALLAVPGIADVKVQLTAPQAILSYEKVSLSLDELQSALDDAGYRISNAIPVPRKGPWSGKVVWVTGATSGIGRAAAMEFAGQGARVILSARRAEVLKEMIANAPTAWQHDLFALPLDLSQATSMPDHVQQALEGMGHVDVLVHCGGISQRSLAKDTSIEVDRHVMEVDYFGTIALTKALLPHYLERQAGQFVVVTSLMGLFSSPLRSGYCGAKHALHGFFESLRAEVHGDGISITMVCPGFIRTEISLNAVVGDGSQQGTMDEKTGSGLSAEACAKQLVRATARRQSQILIGRSELLGAYLKRFFPGLLRKIVRKAAVT